jgi:hypothetical protein
MSDPTEQTHADPHPVSGHRTPAEIAEDEAGPIGQGEERVGARGAPTERSQQIGRRNKAVSAHRGHKDGEDRGGELR